MPVVVTTILGNEECIIVRNFSFSDREKADFLLCTLLIQHIFKKKKERVFEQ